MNNINGAETGWTRQRSREVVARRGQRLYRQSRYAVSQASGRHCAEETVSERLADRQRCYTTRLPASEDEPKGTQEESSRHRFT
jgi:hypothetical protein